MKKHYFIFAAALMALASCSTDDVIGGAQTAGNTSDGAINFAGETGKITRAAKGTSVGPTAANLLGKKFFVLGTKGELPDGNPTETIVFDNYEVDWAANTAGTSDDNTNDWKYVGVTPTGLHAGTTEIKNQSIKYWDNSVSQYDFIAYSVGANTLIKEGTATDGKVLGTAISTPKTTEYKSYTLTAATMDDLKECYYTDIVTVPKADYRKPVQLTFKNLTAKVRVAFYETIPGYTVSDLQFYTDDKTKKGELTNNSSATLYTTGDSKIAKNGSITVTYPVVGSKAKEKTGYNKAFVIVNHDENAASTDTKLGLGNVNYAENNVLATSAKQASMAGDSKNSYYTAVLPAAANAQPLTIRMNYTLTSTDGSKETIHVYGAKAVIPASYTAWQPNYAYTYIFKISDNTNGSTSTDDKDPEGLFPITFDAVVADIDNNDFTHESITTVATPSVTTYAWNTTNNKVVKAYGESAVAEYPTGSDIYFSVADAKGSKTDLDSKGHLYTLDKAATEAEVINALQVQASKEDKVITGRNGLKLTEKDVTKDLEKIPTEDGKTIKVTKNSVVKLGSATEGTYAYVYEQETKADDAKTSIFTAIIPTEGQDITAGDGEYYLDPAGKTAVTANTKLEVGKIYYKKYTNNNNVYGVKVVKVTASATK